MSLLNNNVNNEDHPHVNMLIPPPVLLIILGLSAAGIHWLKWNGFDINSERAFIGGLAILSGFLLMISCVQSFRKEQTPVRPDRIATSKIVRQGVYAYSRNPMYVGMAFILIGLSVALKSPAFFMAAIVFIFIVHFGVVLREERYLLQTYPQEYSEYMRKVRRWL